MGSQKHRLQFDLSQADMAAFDGARDKLGAATRAEVLWKALRVYGWMFDTMNPEDEIIVVDGNGKEVQRFKASLILREF